MRYTKVTAKDVMVLLDVSESSARRKIKLCRDALSLKKRHVLTIDKFRQYYGLIEN
jgi:hypothetical protein